MSYYPAPDDWQTRTPDESGRDARAWPRRSGFTSLTSRWAPTTSWVRCARAADIFVDPDHDLIVVVRWIAKTAVARFLGLVVDAVRH